ncbi:DUF3159 domain-containing protein [Candidatus Bipolaricaulota bacterium]
MKSRHPRVAELFEEFRSVVVGQRSLGDALGPPLVFVLINLIFGIWLAIACAVGLALVITAARLVRHHPLRYALGGLTGVVVASLIAVGLSRGEGYFLPGMASGAVTSMLCLISVMVRRPLVAWTSYIARRWPLDWYWHPRVRPAYSEVTLAWFLFFVLRFGVQVLLFRRGATLALSTVNLLLGWPSISLLLVGSYIYGQWRLRHLQGPSVDEFRDKTSPPWNGQKRGF